MKYFSSVTVLFQLLTETHFKVTIKLKLSDIFQLVLKLLLFSVILLFQLELQLT